MTSTSDIFHPHLEFFEWCNQCPILRISDDYIACRESIRDHQSRSHSVAVYVHESILARYWNWICSLKSSFGNRDIAQ